MFNYSFWADEAYISGIAAQHALGKLSFMQAISSPGITYQRLHMAVVSVFFQLFGVSELIARLPSMIGFILGIIAIFLLARRLSNMYGGAVSAFLYSFSHLSLAYATQAKPYITIEAILLWVLYLLTDKKKINHILVILLCTIANLLHSIGVFMWVVYLVFIVMKYFRSNIQTFKRSNAVLFIALLIAALFILPMVASLFKNGSPFRYNNLYQVVKLFTYKYSFITACSFLGFVWIAKKQREMSVSLVVYASIIFVFVSFVGYIFNIRYVLSFFGLMFLYFGIFWGKVGERFQFKIGGKALIPVLVILIIYITGYKVVRGPQAYYNPNIDKYGDVQIANYKDFYAELKARFPGYQDLYVANDTFDVEYWYFGRYSNAYFMKFTPKPYKHLVADAYVYGSLADFKKIMNEHPQGLLIMEDWQSFLPDDIKEYAKKNLSLEYRVESLNEALDDPWPLALYSWGMNK